jgi:hypothetical protein
LWGQQFWVLSDLKRVSLLKLSDKIVWQKNVGQKVTGQKVTVTILHFDKTYRTNSHRTKSHNIKFGIGAYHKYKDQITILTFIIYRAIVKTYFNIIFEVICNGTNFRKLYLCYQYNVKCISCFTEKFKANYKKSA